MAVRQEAPIRRGPVVRAPEEKKKGHPAGRIIGSAILAGAIGLAAYGGYEVYNNSQKTPEQTPIAGGIGEPTPTQTPEITITPILEVSPTPSVEPSPTPEIIPSPTPDITKWWNQIPENPYKSINEVPVKGGRLEMSATYLKPYYSLEARDMTIVAIKPDVEKNEIWVGITAKGQKVTKTDCKITVVNDSPDINFCNYSGFTLWLEIDSNTEMYRPSTGPYGNGPEDIAPLLKVGDRITIVGIGLSKTPYIKSDQLSMNLATWRKLQSSVGDSISRSGMDFKFYASGIAGL